MLFSVEFNIPSIFHEATDNGKMQPDGCYANCDEIIYCNSKIQQSDTNTLSSLGKLKIFYSMNAPNGAYEHSAPHQKCKIGQ